MSGSWENVTFFYGAVNQNYTDINISLNLGYSYFQAKSYSLHVCSVQQNVTLSCIDSDGGLNYYVKGNATGWSPLINEIYTEVDSCGLDQNGNMTLVFEAGCNGSNVGLYTTNCPLGCFDGKCNFGCGDGIKNLNESCDGADFGSLSCSSYGFNAGSLSCNLNCSVNSTACYTATTNSGSGSSGGSGGGSSGSRATTFTLGDLTTQIPVTSGKGDTITFYVKGSQHKIEITDISQSSVDLTISSKITRLTLNSGETKEVDVDGDGTKDIRISLEKISSKKAYLTVDTIKQTVIVQAICNNNGICEAGEGYNNCQNDCSAEDVIVKPAGEQPRFIEQVICNYNKICDKQETPNTCPSDCKRIGSDWLILAIVAIFAMILIILWVVIERHAKQMPRVSGKIRQEVIALLKMRKNLSEIRSYLLFKKYPEEEVKSALIYANNFNTLRIYVQKCIGYGYTKKEIYLVLKNARWPKELSRDVVESEVNG
jgi:hypothetical protein